MVSPHGLKPCAAPQSPSVLPADVCPLLRCPQRVPACGSDRQLRGRRDQDSECPFRVSACSRNKGPVTGQRSGCRPGRPPLTLPMKDGAARRVAANDAQHVRGRLRPCGQRQASAEHSVKRWCAAAQAQQDIAHGLADQAVVVDNEKLHGGRGGWRRRPGSVKARRSPEPRTARSRPRSRLSTQTRCPSRWLRSCVRQCF